MSFTQTVIPQVSEFNLQTYQRLKGVLQLELRRQIFILVCDDLNVQHHLANFLSHDLEPEKISPSSHAPLISLNLNLENPNFLLQIAQWIKNNPLKKETITTPHFQILGIEGLTQKSALVQQDFLKYLQILERYLPQLKSNLLFWVSYPWFQNIQNSVPEFWRWHTGIFEFQGQPTFMPIQNTTALDFNLMEMSLGGKKGKIVPILPEALEIEESEIPPEAESSPEENIIHHDELSLPLLEKTSTPLSSQQSQGEKYLRLGYQYQHDFENGDLNLENLIQAIQSYEEALKYLDEELEIIPVLHELGNLYWMFSRHNETNSKVIFNLEKASQAYQQALDYLRSRDNTTRLYEIIESNLDQVYGQLRSQCRERLEQGEVSIDNLAKAINAYEQALEYYEQSLEENHHDAKKTADIFNELGNFYWMLSRQTQIVDEIISNLEHAVQSYEQALENLSGKDHLELYTTLLNNIGAAYNDLSHYVSPAENLQLSIKAYQKGLQDYRNNPEWQQWGHTQNNLGTAYWHLAQYQDSIDNLQLAITAYDEALTQYNPQDDPLDWAMVENNLGTAYWNLFQYEQEKNHLEKAIQYYSNALQYRTPQIAPSACATTQNNLGTTYWHLAEQFPEKSYQRQEHLKKAVTTYELALAITEQLTIQESSIALNFDSFATYNNLGIIHQQLALGFPENAHSESKEKHLESALKSHINALQGMKPETENYQTTFNYLIQVIHQFYQERGVNGQSRALSLIPGELLPDILPNL